MSKPIEKIKYLWKRLRDPEYRGEYAAQVVYQTPAAQIYALREQRGWTQSELARRAGMMQPRISKLESSCEGARLETLARLASAFDVALSVKFVRFSDMVCETLNERVNAPVPPFEEDHAPRMRNGVPSRAIIEISETLTTDAPFIENVAYGSDNKIARFKSASGNVTLDHVNV